MCKEGGRIWFTLLQEYDGQIQATAGEEGRGQMCNLVPAGHLVYLAEGVCRPDRGYWRPGGRGQSSTPACWAIWFTFLKEYDNGQIEAAGGQEGGFHMSKLILQLGI
jgi:hypothetical protein